MPPPTWVSSYKCELCDLGMRHLLGDWLAPWERWAVMWDLHMGEDPIDGWGDDA
jgi:hypothetical protein